MPSNKLPLIVTKHAVVALVHARFLAQYTCSTWPVGVVLGEMYRCDEETALLVDALVA